MSFSYAGRRLARRGTAEIELILSVVVFITILMLVVGATKIAVARLNMARSSQFQVLQDATASQSPQYTGNSDLEPIAGTQGVRPTLPNRTHVSEPTTDIIVSTSNTGSPSTFTVGGKAGLVSPAWAYSAYPIGGQDLADTQQWFSEYVTESHGTLTDPLRLAPSWTP